MNTRPAGYSYIARRWFNVRAYHINVIACLLPLEIIKGNRAFLQHFGLLAAWHRILTRETDLCHKLKLEPLNQLKGTDLPGNPIQLTQPVSSSSPNSLKGPSGSAILSSTEIQPFVKWHHVHRSLKQQTSYVWYYQISVSFYIFQAIRYAITSNFKSRNIPFLLGL